MARRKAEAVWKGDALKGRGSLRLGSGTFEGAYSFGTRFEEEPGTNPEELLGAAHASCFSMALAGMLQQAGYQPERLDVGATVQIEPSGDQAFVISTVALEAVARVPGIDEATFQEVAEAAKIGCAVSQVLRNGSAAISLRARLAQAADLAYPN